MVRSAGGLLQVIVFLGPRVAGWEFGWCEVQGGHEGTPSRRCSGLQGGSSDGAKCRLQGFRTFVGDRVAGWEFGWCEVQDSPAPWCSRTGRRLQGGSSDGAKCRFQRSGRVVVEALGCRVEVRMVRSAGSKRGGSVPGDRGRLQGGSSDGAKCRNGFCAGSVQSFVVAGWEFGWCEVQADHRGRRRGGRIRCRVGVRMVRSAGSRTRVGRTAPIGVAGWEFGWCEVQVGQVARVGRRSVGLQGGSSDGAKCRAFWKVMLTSTCTVAGWEFGWCEVQELDGFPASAFAATVAGWEFGWCGVQVAGDEAAQPADAGLQGGGSDGAECGLL